MSTVRIALAEPLWEELCAALASREEAAGIILGGLAEGDHGVSISLNHIEWISPGSIEEATATSMSIRSDGWMPALGRAAEGGWQPLFFHTHPDNLARPSSDDRRVAERLAPVFSARTGKPYASLIFGGEPKAPTFTGTYGDRAIEIARVIGDRFRFLPAEGVVNVPAPAAFDRQVLAFGEPGQQLLKRLRVGVVGAGGTGSAVFEQLVRLGVGTIVLIDDDVVTDTNLTRIHESGVGDVGEPKVATLAAAAERIGLGTEVLSLEAKLTERRGFEAIRGCDIVFGCTDDNAGRAILSRLAYYYCLPVLDVGAVIGSRGGRMAAVEARLTVVAPGTPCLFCRNRIELDRLREEMQEEDEVRALVQEGYARGLDNCDPAVISYTTMIAAFATDEMLQRLFGFGLPHPASELVVQASQRVIRALPGAPIPGHFCDNPEIFGRGDIDPHLGRVWS